MERNHNLHGSLWVDQKDFAERLSRRFKGVWNEKFHGWNVECPYCPKHETKERTSSVKEEQGSLKVQMVVGCFNVQSAQVMEETLLEYR